MPTPNDSIQEFRLEVHTIPMLMFLDAKLIKFLK